jgi:CMP/dCMP kinase
MNVVERELIIAIDGPSGVGKSTLSKRLAGALDYVNLDTGAMYRAVALATKRRGIDPGDGPALAALCQGLRIEFLRGRHGERVLLDGEDVSEEIRTPEVSLLTSRVAACLEVRHALVALQRQLGQGGGVVLEGRDIGTVVFPEAEVKFFLLASAAERARRRFEELRARGVAVELDRTLREVEARDAADSAREHAPLLQADDAVPIDTTQMTIEQVLAEMLRIVGERRAGLKGSAS